jgi:G3E family GTPase
LIAHLTLVVGAHIDARENAIARLLQGGVSTAVILEGLPSGSGLLSAEASPDELWIARIAPGCLCCIGNLTLRVTLNRMLRKRPHRIYISVADATHLSTLEKFLSAAPYDNLLQLTPVIDCDAAEYGEHNITHGVAQQDRD